MRPNTLLSNFYNSYTTYLLTKMIGNTSWIYIFNLCFLFRAFTTSEDHLVTIKCWESRSGRQISKWHRCIFANFVFKFPRFYMQASYNGQKEDDNYLGS